MTPQPAPAKYFAVPPYLARQADEKRGLNGWWYVENAHGVNCLTFRKQDSSTTGAVFTSQEHAMGLAKEWNQTKD